MERPSPMKNFCSYGSLEPQCFLRPYDVPGGYPGQAGNPGSGGGGSGSGAAVVTPGGGFKTPEYFRTQFNFTQSIKVAVPGTPQRCAEVRVKPGTLVQVRPFATNVGSVYIG